uniref:Putative ribonuclease H-like domain-containing protein n=1 Tax=Tanacetum cinerariifolium TaxID=118510 RepID=A0A6L2K997_TANCI|nr:putative ribonuclease H-like domain-containing protein [Tanacetum cinerariifolium]
MNYEPVVAGTQSKGFVGSKASDNADSKSSQDDGFKPSSDDGKKVDNDPNFVVYQVDVKSAFLYGKIEEEVYVCQPLGLEDLDFPDRVYKVEKALHGLHQAPKAWYETLSTYLLDNGFQRGKINMTLFIKSHKEVKNASTPIESQNPILKDEDGEEVDVYIYRYQVNPKVLDLCAVKRIFRYLKGKAKKNVRLMMDKLFEMELELILLFWSTAMTKTINEESQIHARVDGKEIIITESSVRRDLQLAYEYGVDCLPNSIIFENLNLMGTMESAIICLATNQKFNFSNFIFDSMIRNLDNASGKFLMYPRKPKRRNTQVPQPSGSTEHVADKAVYKERGDSLVRATITVCTLEAEQDSARVDSSKDKQNLGEDAYKQGSKIHDIDANEDITLVNDQDDAEMFDVNDLHGEDVFIDKDDTDKVVNDEVQKVVKEVVEDINTTKLIVDATQVNVVGELNAASITVSAAATITIDEVTLAKALAELKASIPKVKGVVIQEPSENTTTTTTKIISSKSHDKGKVIMVEEPMKPKKKEQIKLDEEATLKLQAEFKEEQRLAREKAQKN